MKKLITTYVHKEDDYNVEEAFASEDWKDEETMYKAMNWGYEIEFEIEVDSETGNAEVIAIDLGDGKGRRELS